MRFDAFADFRQQFPAPRRVASLAAHQKPGLHLAFSKDVSDKVFEQPLHIGAAGTRRAE